MKLTALVDWLTWGALILPLAVVAWSGVQYVSLRKAEASQKKFENFFRTIERVHNVDGSLIAQKAAAFELRNYPEYRDVILRICDDAPTLFPSVDPRISIEFSETAEYLRERT